MPMHWVLSNLVEEMQRFSPYNAMNKQQLESLLDKAELVYFADGESINPLQEDTVWLIRRGTVICEPVESGYALHAGDLLFVDSVNTDATNTRSLYLAQGDVFCLKINKTRVTELEQSSAVFAKFCRQATQQLVDTLQRNLQQSLMGNAFEQHNINRSLATLPRKNLIQVSAFDSIRQALTIMHQHKVGSTLVTEQGKVVGILTQPDIVGRIVLAEVELDLPVSTVMSQPVTCIDEEASIVDAMLLMAKQHIRHLPIMAQGQLVNFVSERDLYQLQQRSLKSIAKAVHHAHDLSMLKNCAAQIKQLSKELVSQGLQAKQLTILISHFNDLLTTQVLKLNVRQFQLDPQDICWLALGSEGRQEQVIATDQDNAIIYREGAVDAKHLAVFCQQVNEQLDVLGFPLCKGNVMASNPEFFGDPLQWCQRIRQWITVANPKNLLNVNIFFDFRPIYGNSELVAPLREEIRVQLKKHTMFLYWLADSVMARKPPLNWLGGLAPTQTEQGKMLDLKALGTAVFVDSARVLALKYGIEASNTTERLEAIAAHLNVGNQKEVSSWIQAFHHLQLLRLERQLQYGDTLQSFNTISIDKISNLEKRLLTSCFREAENLQAVLNDEFRRS